MKWKREYEHNPFLKEMGIWFPVDVFNGSYINSETGALEKSIKRSYRIEDNYKFFRVYRGSNLERVYTEFTLNDFRLFFWVGTNTRKNQDWIEVAPSLVYKEMGIARRVYLERSLIHLVELGFLAPMLGVVDTYWYNPSYIYNGDRKLLIQDENGSLNKQFTRTYEKKIQPLQPNEDFLIDDPTERADETDIDGEVDS